MENKEKNNENLSFDDLKKQNFKDNMEFIFVNDGGSNTLEDIIVDFAKKDSRVLLISKKNGGVSSARNKGIDVARGEWIMFVDSDDTIPGDSLENLLLKDNGEYDIISGIYHNLHNNILILFSLLIQNIL